MIGTLCNNYDNALQTLRSIKAAGYEAIELNDFMIRKTALSVCLNRVGKVLAERGIRLLYHNHNVELQKVAPGKTASSPHASEDDSTSSVGDTATTRANVPHLSIVTYTQGVQNIISLLVTV